MKILAIDPAAKCGFAHSDGHYGVWDLSSSRKEHPGARLERIRSKLYRAKRDWGFDAIAYEDAQLGSHNFTTQGLHAEIRGVIKLIAREMGDVPIIEVNPSSLKKFATGNGRADKLQMIRAAKTMLGIETDDDNIADALFVLEYAKQPQKPKAPPKRRSRGKRTTKSKQLSLLASKPSQFSRV